MWTMPGRKPRCGKCGTLIFGLSSSPNMSEKSGILYNRVIDAVAFIVMAIGVKLVALSIVLGKRQ